MPTTRVLLPVDRAAFVVALGLRLRGVGVPVTFTSLGALADAFEAAPPADVEDLYWTARVTLVGHAHDLPLFDRVFAAVFRGAALPVEGQATGPPVHRSGADAALAMDGPGRAGGSADGLPWQLLPRSAQADGGAGHDEDHGVPELLPSAVAAVADTPFEDLDDEQVAMVGAWIESWWRRWPTRRGRRRHVHPAGRRIELRRTIADARRTGWEPVALARSRSVRRPRPLTMVVDVSQSMQPYATAYLHLMRALARTGRAEAFAFSTSLTRVTPALRHRSAREAMVQAGEQVVDRYGGTHLAASLHALWSSPHGQALRGGVLVVASDGWDSDEPEELAAVLERIRLRAHRVVWLNPRAAAPGFEPLVGSMAAALPYCDSFLPAHTARATLDALDAILGPGAFKR